jgi:hypothetical protein
MKSDASWLAKEIIVSGIYSFFAFFFFCAWILFWSRWFFVFLSRVVIVSESRVVFRIGEDVVAFRGCQPGSDWGPQFF